MITQKSVHKLNIQVYELSILDMREDWKKTERMTGTSGYSRMRVVATTIEGMGYFPSDQMWEIKPPTIALARIANPFHMDCWYAIERSTGTIRGRN